MRKLKFRAVPLTVYLCALFVFIASILGSTLIFHRSPNIHDEFGYIFQAKLFASGHLYVPSPCFKEAFDFPHIINNGKWYSQYPPGYPLLLVPWVAAGIPWLINPVFAALSIILFYFLGLELFGKREGLIAAILGAASIWLIIMSSTIMSHTTNMFFFALFMLFIFKSIKNPSPMNGIMAGTALGMAFLIRPYESLLAAIPFLFYYGFKVLKNLRQSAGNAILLVAVLLLFGGIFLGYNYLTNGNPFLMGHIIRYGPEHGIGFGKTGYTGMPHTPGKGVMKIGENYKAINDFLFGWPLSSLIFILFCAFPDKNDKNIKEIILLLFGSLACLSAGLFVYWGAYVFLGARLFFVSLPVLVLLTAYGFFRLYIRLPSHLQIGQLSMNLKPVLAVLFFLMVSYGFLITLRTEISPSDKQRLVPGLNHLLKTVSLCLDKNKPDAVNNLVIVNFLHSAQTNFPSGGWEPVFSHVDPFLKEPTIFARDMKSRNTETLQCFPERTPYLYWGTPDKGMLVPIKYHNGSINYENPIGNTEEDTFSTKLVSYPEEVFFLYSDSFKSFLKQLFRRVNFVQINAWWLECAAEEALRRKDFTSATMLLEAALQVEKEPVAKNRLLLKMAGTYRRSGQIRESDIIFNSINSNKPINIYRVLPERGF